MDNQEIHVLLIEDTSPQTRLNEQPETQFQLKRCAKLEAGIEHLKHNRADVVLLNLDLPDNRGIETFSKLHGGAPGVPVVILSGGYDSQTALAAIREGPRDYLRKAQLAQTQMQRSLLSALESARDQAFLAGTAEITPPILDRVSGLLNLSGFTADAEQRLNTARQNRDSSTLLLIDIGNLITAGIANGDEEYLPTEFAVILKNTFRKSDIIGRISPNKFAVLIAGGYSNLADCFAARLDRNTRNHLSLPTGEELFIGTAECNATRPKQLDELFEQASERLFELKASISKVA